LAADLRRLQADHLVRPIASGTPRKVRTYHDRIRESVVAGMDEVVLKSWHGKLARGIEASDNPDLIVACVVGDGEAETGPLATSWHSNKFLNPAHDGAVLPILHLNGYKIANPTILSRISRKEVESLFIGYGYKPYFVEGSEPEVMHQLMAKTMDKIISEIRSIQIKARKKGNTKRPQWPMIVLRTPKGWTGPKEVDGKKWQYILIPHDLISEQMTLDGLAASCLYTGRN